MSTETVTRNARRRIAFLREHLTECRVYAPENGFQGKAADPKLAWDAFDGNPRTRLVSGADGSYTIRVRDSLWYELRTASGATPEMEALIEAGSLGTPAAKALRARGRRMLYGDKPPDRDRIYAIGEDLTAGRISEDEAYKRFLDAGCLPAGARFHVRLRQAEREAERQ